MLFRCSLRLARPVKMVQRKVQAKDIMKESKVPALDLPFDISKHMILWASAVAVRDCPDPQLATDTMKEAAKALLSLVDEARELQVLLQDPNPELRVMAQEDWNDLISRVRSGEEAYHEAMECELDEQVADLGDTWTVEVKGMAGGTEAWLFAEELLGAYRSYANIHRWDMVDLSVKEDDARSLSLKLTGPDVQKRMRYEIGVHRIQRIPTTEASGRLQTSTAAVTLLPQPKAIDLGIQDKDIEISMAHGSGPGGQGVNTSANCVRLLHKPSGIHIRCHVARSANANRQLAMDILAQKLWERKKKEQEGHLSSLLGEQWVSGERSEKIRTYNTPQNRVTDHRLDLSVHDYDAVMNGQLDDFIDPLLERDNKADELNALLQFTNKLAAAAIPKSDEDKKPE
eukprot:PhM_4_TR14534/c0_g5_i1/m.3067/K02835/prfA, MTRF1, MRF1; peptide chain release factor 1